MQAACVLRTHEKPLVDVGLGFSPEPPKKQSSWESCSIGVPHACGLVTLNRSALWLQGAVCCPAGCSVGLRRLNQTEALHGLGPSGGKLAGSVHGGQQPIVARMCTCFSNTTAMEVHRIAADTRGNTTQDSSGGATTATTMRRRSGRELSISGNYTCTANSQVYAYVLRKSGAGLTIGG